MIVILVFLLLLLAFLAFEDQPVARYRHFDILGIQPRQFGRDLISLVVFAHIDRRSREDERAPRRFEVGHAAKRGKTKAAGEFFEQSIHLAAERAPHFRDRSLRLWSLFNLHRYISHPFLHSLRKSAADFWILVRSGTLIQVNFCCGVSSPGR